MSKFIMLATEQPRSRAYIQKLIKENMLPSFVIYLNKNNESKNFISDNRTKVFFDVNKLLKTSLIENNIEYVEINDINCNSERVINELKNRNEEYVVFSASGILKSEILNCGKKFIHVHPGNIPEYRGSTCFYYSMIKEGSIGATAFIMSDGIDQGEIIRRDEYEVPFNLDIDNIYDPYIRAETLYKVIKEYNKNNNIQGEIQDISIGETYHVIHPILKHLAVKKYTKSDAGKVYWFLGLSGSGKSTLAKELYKKLKNASRNVKLLDGDEVRKALGNRLGYSIEERRRSVETMIYLAKLLSENGVDVIVAHISAFEDLRIKARQELINYTEIYVKCSIEECARRDVKGYYKKALSGDMKNFIGVDQKFEEPIGTDIILDTEKNSLDYCIIKIEKIV